MSTRLNITNANLIDEVVAFIGSTEVTTQGLKDFCEAAGYKFSTINNRFKNYRTGRGKFSLPTAEIVEQLEHTLTQDVVPTESYDLTPEVDELYVPFGNFKDLSTIIKSGLFYPTYIQGLSGNGKTQSVEQVCAKLKRELIRVNFTVETDESDLIGGFRLVDGNTVFQYGPVVEALKRGAILLLDEVDLASNKVLCLQSILEGKGLYLKKTGEFIQPAPGFNIIAAANTKGKGCETGKFIGANVQNEAFLDRFAVTFEQGYPTPAIESKILVRNFTALKIDECMELVNNLVTWADIIRRTYTDGGIEDVITTRRLVNIARAYAIWGDIDKAIELCTNRFDDDTKSVFRELFAKVSGSVQESEDAPHTGSYGEPASF